MSGWFHGGNDMYVFWLERRRRGLRECQVKKDEKCKGLCVLPLCRQSPIEGFHWQSSPSAAATSVQGHSDKNNAVNTHTAPHMPTNTNTLPVHRAIYQRQHTQLEHNMMI